MDYLNMLEWLLCVNGCMYGFIYFTGKDVIPSDKLVNSSLTIAKSRAGELLGIFSCFILFVFP